LALAPPLDSARVRLSRQNLTLNGLRFRLSRDRAHTERRIITVARRAGIVGLEADFTVHFFPAAKQREKTKLSAAERQLYLSRQEGIDPDSAPVARAATQISAAGPASEGLPAQIFQYIRAHVAFSKTAADGSGGDALKRGRGGDLAQARAMAALCRALQVPARVVTGFILEARSVTRPQHWVQVYLDARWVGFDPARGHADGLPPGYVAFSHDSALLSLNGAHLRSAAYDLSQQAVPVNLAGVTRESPVAIMDMSRLPLLTRATLATLMLLPLGALLNAFVRSIVGVRTYGTFTPALLALAAVYVAWITALTVFAVVAVFAFFGRFMLPGLKLSRAPRLTIVLTMVALSMSLAVSIMAYFDLLTDPHVVLLPIVILTALVDRIYTVVDEDGLRAAAIRLAWTALVALGCFFILTQEALGELLVHYPELHLTTIALIIVLSRYNGPKLSGIPGLKWLAGRAPKTKEAAPAGEAGVSDGGSR
ncbi:MAG TPA: 7TM domain-containing protein, partial [Gammaproteobacteria bacterium]|nr:7TM domain-containing protein [Gammaproteobacteria bacterium]